LVRVPDKTTDLTSGTLTLDALEHSWHTPDQETSRLEQMADALRQSLLHSDLPLSTQIETIVAVSFGVDECQNNHEIHAMPTTS